MSRAGRVPPADPVRRRQFGSLRLRLAAVAGLALVGALAGVAAWVALDDDGEPPVRLDVQADLSQLTAGVEPSEALRQVQDNLERRLAAFGATGSAVSVENPDRIAVTLRNIDPDTARRLVLKSAFLEARQPRLDESGGVVCGTAKGDTFSSPAKDITYVPVPSSVTRLPACVDSAGQHAEILWQPAGSSGAPGETQTLDGTSLEKDGATVLSADRPVLALQFNADGSALLSQITERLINLPLGIFVDDELLFGPTVKESITNGRLDIFGLSLHDARILAAQLNAGPLPAPLSEVPPTGTPQ